MNSPAPVLFVSHGAPTFALEPGQLGPALTALGQRQHAARAVLVVSPHWQTRELAVTLSRQPETVHDFGGFPPAMYRLRYPVPDPLPFASKAMQTLACAGLRVAGDDHRGLDHGAWVPLMHLLPAGADGVAPLPVFQVSLPVHYGPAEAWRLGRALSALRDEGVLIVGSGSMTHNLREVQWGDAAPAPYVAEFSRWVEDAVARGDDDAVIAYRQHAPHAARAHPTEEHFLPLLVALGARRHDDAFISLAADTTHGVLSMSTFGWGWPQV